MADNSRELEMMEILEDVRLHRQPVSGLNDAVADLDVVDGIYRDTGYDHRA
jgi:hypothetical protein